MTATRDPLGILAGMRLEDGRRWGEVAADWQLADAQAILTPGPDDPRLHWLGRPKGGSKTTDLGGIGSAWLLTQADPLEEAYVIAADQDQAKRLLDRAAGLIARSGLDGELEVQRHAIVNRASGARLVALAADAAGAEGITTRLILVDELPQWADTKASRGMWDAAYSTIPKVKGLRFAVIGHAGITGSWQHKLYERFKASPLWRVVDVPGPLSWTDPLVLDDQRATLADSQYARRHLNEWASSTDLLATLDDLRACVTLAGPLVPQGGVRYVIALDLGVKNDRTVAAVMHAEALDGSDPYGVAPHVSERLAMDRDLLAQGAITHAQFEHRHARAEGNRGVRVVLDRMEVWQGSRLAPVQLSEVEAWIEQAHHSFNQASLVVDPWQAVGMAQRLRGRGVTVDEFTFSSASVGRLASVLHRLLRDRALALPDDEELISELVGVRLVERTPGVLRLDHDAGSHDDRAIALALGAQHLLQAPPQRPVVSIPYENRALRGSR